MQLATTRHTCHFASVTQLGPDQVAPACSWLPPGTRATSRASPNSVRTKLRPHAAGYHPAHVPLRERHPTRSGPSCARMQLATTRHTCHFAGVTQLGPDQVAPPFSCPPGTPAPLP